jgi:hypothetical protein
MSETLTPPPRMPAPIMLPGDAADPGMRAEGLPDTAESAALLSMLAAENADGSVTLTPDDSPAATDPRDVPWGENIADHLGDHALASLADRVLDNLRADLASNAEHYAGLTEGLDALGLRAERLDKPFKGAAGARATLTLRAATRFNATAMGELCPAAGPVRTQVNGDAAGIDGAAARKARFLNHYLTSEDEGYYPDRDQGLLLLGLLGSTFRMVYRDPYDGRPKSRFRTPFNLVVSYHASELHHGGRFTEVDRLPASEVRRLQVIGHWRDVELGTPAAGGAEDKAGQLREAEGRAASDLPEDAEHTVYTQRLIADIPGLEHLGADGEPTGLALPWRVAVDLDSRQVLRIDRDWDPDDPALRPRDHFAHERYMPGLGYYGIGFAHLLAQSQDAQTTLLRQGLNANTLVSFPGGLRAKGARMEQFDVAIGPCEFREVDTAGMPIGNAVMPLPYRDVPPSFVPLMQQIAQEGEQLGQVAEMQVGEGRQDAPVGSTLALIEQAVRVESAVVKRLHTAQRRELRLLAKLFAEDPEAVYPFSVDGQHGRPIAPDFAGSQADIVPVSDPNVPTMTQRLTLAQAKLTLAQSAPPGMFDLREAHLQMLRTVGCEEGEIARLMPPPGGGTPADPIAEFASAVRGEPLAVAPMQAHDAHIKAHIAQLKFPNLPPPVAQSLLAHAGEHLAAHYRNRAAVALGGALPPPGQPLPPEVEAQLAVAFAQVAEAVTAEIAPLLADGKDAADPHKAEELKIKAAALAQKEADAQRKALAAARQDAGEMIRTEVQAREAAADRRLELVKLQQESAAMELDTLRDAAHLGHDAAALALEAHESHAGRRHEARQAGAERSHRQRMAKEAARKPKAGLG